MLTQQVEQRRRELSELETQETSISRSLGLARQELESCFARSDGQLTYEEFRSCVDPAKGSGSVRVSLGMFSNPADIETFTEFARRLIAE